MALIDYHIATITGDTTLTTIVSGEQLSITLRLNGASGCYDADVLNARTGAVLLAGVSAQPYCNIMAQQSKLLLPGTLYLTDGDQPDLMYSMIGGE